MKEPMTVSQEFKETMQRVTEIIVADVNLHAGKNARVQPGILFLGTWNININKYINKKARTYGDAAWDILIWG